MSLKYYLLSVEYVYFSTGNMSQSLNTTILVNLVSITPRRCMLPNQRYFFQRISSDVCTSLSSGPGLQKYYIMSFVTAEHHSHLFINSNQKNLSILHNIIFSNKHDKIFNCTKVTKQECADFSEDLTTFFSITVKQMTRHKKYFLKLLTMMHICMPLSIICLFVYVAFSH